MPNYKEVKDLIIAREPFKHGHSMKAVRTSEAYEIFSYSTLIATFNFETCAWWINENKYSVTTSKQQNLIRVAAGISHTDSLQFP